ncbi:MAG: rRNA cytosine-C5-methyltransferase [Bacteroidales bacterium]|nr:rRNA cytosine-C5-methyltransferase [Candidatus Physcocola equi]
MDLPIAFVERIQSEFGDDAQAFLDAVGTDPSVSIRLNPSKLCDLKMADEVPWCPGAFYLKQRPVFTLDPLFNAGAYYVQEAGSMFSGYVFKQLKDESPMVVLDLCAAPGGKSTHLASVMNGDGLLVCNEVVKNRVAPLRENITKWGFPNVVVTNAEASDFGNLEGCFDAVVIDAPCSGEGMFRKDDQAVTEWSEQNVDMCASRQRDILKNVWPALKVGGLLIYSTCTYNRQENEENVRFISESLGADILRVPCPPEWGVTATEEGYHFYPYKSRGEGFFLAALRKTSDQEQCVLSKKDKKDKKAKNAKTPAVPSALKSWILDSEKYDFSLSKEGDWLIAFPSAYADLLEALRANCRVAQSGVAVATLKGKDFVPAPALALSSALNKAVFSVVDLEWEDAMSFLKRENLVLTDTAPKGWVLLAYKNVPLGWTKNLGNRSNGAYPAEWHVRMAANRNDYTDLFDI